MNEDYKARLARLDLIDSPEVINNTSTEHARLMAARMFGRARTSIKMLTGSCNREVYGDLGVLDALGTFLLGRSGTLEILIHDPTSSISDDQITEDGSTIALLVDRFGPDTLRKISIKRIGAPVRDRITSHFFVVDDKSFRFEQDCRKHEAVGSFNQPSIATNLNDLFDKIFSASDAIQLRVPA